MDYLNADPTETLMYDAILRAGQKILFDLQKRQAGLIASEVSKMFKG